MTRTSSEFAYTYLDIAKLTGMSDATVRRHKSRASFDPADLGSVLLFIARHGTPELRKALLEHALRRDLPKERVKLKRTKGD